MTDTPAICGQPIPVDYDPPACTRPAGHPGPHHTSIIPAPLAPVAAKMVAEADSLESEREHFRAMRAMYQARMHRLRAMVPITTALVASNLVATIYLLVRT